jgi:hypothetical protein
MLIMAMLPQQHQRITDADAVCGKSSHTDWTRITQT